MTLPAVLGPGRVGLLPSGVLPRHHGREQTSTTNRHLKSESYTHMPYRSWCQACLRARARGTYHKQQYDRGPLLQADFSYRNLCINVTTGVASSCVVPKKSVGVYHLAELRRFVLE